MRHRDLFFSWNTKSGDRGTVPAMQWHSDTDRDRLNQDFCPAILAVASLATKWMLNIEHHDYMSDRKGERLSWGKPKSFLAKERFLHGGLRHMARWLEF